MALGERRGPPVNNTNQQPDLREEVKKIAAIAEGVVKMSKAMKAIEDGPLKRETIVILIHHNTKLSLKAINKVLTSLSQLEELYVKPRTKKKEGTDL